MVKPAPIRGLSAGSALRAAGPRILAARLGDVDRQQAGVPAEEVVHDMRVAVRRLRAALRLLGLLELDGPVKGLQDSLGAVRDLQLQIAWLAGRDDALAARLGAGLRKAEAALSRALEEWRTRTVPALLEPVKLRGKLGGGRVRRLLRGRLARLEKRLEAALQRPDAARMHAVRRSVKQIRYLFELAPFEKLSQSLLAELTPLQQSLGELHDVDVRIALLKPGPLLREQAEVRQRLAGIVGAGLSRWKKQEIALSTRKSLR